MSSSAVVAAAGGCRLVLEPRSLLVLQREARYAWAHRVPADATAEVNGHALVRGQRHSLVFWSTQVDPHAPPVRRSTDRVIRLVSSSPLSSAA